MSRRWRGAGFTLIELLVTVAIIGVLASLVVPLGEVAAQRAREAELRNALRTLREGLDAYKRAVDAGRVARRADDSGYPPTLEALVEGVPDAKQPDRRRIHFLRRIPRDPFFPGDADVPAARTWGLRSYASPPDAPAPGDDVFDVYSTSDRVGLNGIPYREW